MINIRSYDDYIINENNSAVGGCQLEICKGKTFKVTSLKRLSDLYNFLWEKEFKLVNYGVLPTYTPAPAPSNSPYPVSAKVAWEFKSGDVKINISQRNECITSCPQIYVTHNLAITDKEKLKQYSILDDKEYQRFKKDVDDLHNKIQA